MAESGTKEQASAKTLGTVEHLGQEVTFDSTHHSGEGIRQGLPGLRSQTLKCSYATGEEGRGPKSDCNQAAWVQHGSLFTAQIQF